MPNSPAVDLKAMCVQAALPVQKASFHSEIEQRIEGRTIRLRKKILINLIGFPTSVLPFAATYMTKDRAGNIDRIRMHFEENECTMAWVEGDEENTVVCGMDGHYRYGQIRLGRSTIRYAAPPPGKTNKRWMFGFARCKPLQCASFILYSKGTVCA